MLLAEVGTSTAERTKVEGFNFGQRYLKNLRGSNFCLSPFVNQALCQE